MLIHSLSKYLLSSHHTGQGLRLRTNNERQGLSGNFHSAGESGQMKDVTGAGKPIKGNRGIEGKRTEAPAPLQKAQMNDI